MIEPDRQTGEGGAHRAVRILRLQRQFGAGAPHRFSLSCGIEDGKARRYAGFEGKLAQQLLAEGVQRLDLQPTRGLEGQSEQAPRCGQAVRVIVAFVATFETGQGLGQRLVRRDGEAAQGLEQATLHLRRGGLGEGHAEDRFRLCAAEQKPCDPVHQRLGLAGAGVRADPGRQAGVGGGHLGIEDWAHPSSPSAPTCDHSARRARWS